MNVSISDWLVPYTAVMVALCGFAMVNLALTDERRSEGWVGQYIIFALVMVPYGRVFGWW